MAREVTLRREPNGTWTVFCVEVGIFAGWNYGEDLDAAIEAVKRLAVADRTAP